jgi:hypothetical protein
LHKNICAYRAERKNGGIQAAAARVLKIERASVCERVAKSEVLQQAIREGKMELVDVARDNVVQAIHDQDMVTTRWALERFDPEYVTKREIRELTPPDPNAEAHRMKAIAFFSQMIEERIRAGLPPIFAEPTQPRRENPHAPMIELNPVTPKKPNGHGGNGHG